MTVLILDNYDSFVYNLARYVAELGFHPVVYRNDALTLEAIRILNPSHIIISPGPRTPQEAGISLSVIQTFYQTMPILGVCLGHQAIAAAFGGDVVHAQYPMHGKSCAITHTQTGLFKHLPNPLRVGRYHSLVACPQSLPDCLIVSAYDVHQEIMALQHRHFPVFGVQFHPESVLTEHGHALLNVFLEK
jgi:anthranilate synthase/aminodeoxychorismate synthase-like glutamine amidotransferase